ncbi:hypothetical protein CPTD_00587 [Corynebacterium pseudotuberculosis]|nr:hypothetical protein CPTC_00261 [Corynebacterium pseudotuberculosis]AQL50513.1 hypothetical protein CpPA04_0401 [Corynebacterium pseudotuberculosis]ATQ64722.1 Hypothetical protein CpPA07_0402 [Corynebacterium pseudotuberculosis]KEX88849.1 hypothetical protein CPTD_00587 [Corynebacterium pseudotuberculosis]
MVSIFVIPPRRMLKQCLLLLFDAHLNLARSINAEPGAF